GLKGSILGPGSGSCQNAPRAAHSGLQRTKLIGAMAMVIKNLRNTRIVSMTLQDLGRRHEEMGVEREHCPMVGAALLETFAGFFGEKWTPDVKEAWTDAYDAIAAMMYEGCESSKEAA
ncbi:MAG: globin domain-containing protein, partial [bacterium]